MKKPSSYKNATHEVLDDKGNVVCRRNRWSAQSKAIALTVETGREHTWRQM